MVLAQCLELTQTLHGHFDLEEEPGVTGPDPGDQVAEGTSSRFYEPAFAQDGTGKQHSVDFFLTTPCKDTQKKDSRAASEPGRIGGMSVSGGRGGIWRERGGRGSADFST